MRRLSAFIGWLLLLLLSGLILFSPAYAAKITVKPERSPVYADEEFTLTFSSNEQPDGNPDFSPLEPVLEIINQSTSSNTQIINGVVSKEIAWRLQVFPKASGVIRIPAIKFGKDSSHPINIVVSDNKNKNGQPDEVIVELESSAENPYVQQQIIITQRLLHSVPLRRTGASMTHPRISSGKGVVQQLGGIENTTVLRKGIRYRVSERRYALFAQNSGKLTLGRTVFQGILDDGTNRRDFFGMTGQQVRRFSAPLELEIRPQPPKSGATWLPGKNLSINAHWERPPNQFKTGEPVTLTLAVIAEGLLAEQLPELEVLPPKGIKAYSNQPDLINNSEGDSVLATRQEKWILIGTAPGEYKLPQIVLRWWNLETGALEVAEVPPTLITVTGEVDNNLPEAVLPEDEAALPTAEAEDTDSAVGSAGESGENPERLISPEADAEKDDIPDAAQRQAVGKPPFSAFWLWLAGLLALALVTVGITWRRYTTRNTRRTYKRSVAKHRVSPLDLLQKACRNDEAQKAYDALSDWVKQDLQLRPATLSQLRKEADFPLKQALDDLSMALYSSQYDVWEGRDLWEAVTWHRRPKETVQSAQSGLVSLYPD